jgi:cytoskeletal protein CcmA (bactofilin family)
MENKPGSLMIGEGVKIDGNIDLSVDVHVYGTVNGEIRAQDVFVGESGIVNGLVVADNIEVRGQIQQTLEARQTLILKATGKITGNIIYQSLEIESGGTIDGKVDKYNPKKDKDILAITKVAEENV